MQLKLNNQIKSSKINIRFEFCAVKCCEKNEKKNSMIVQNY